MISTELSGTSRKQAVDVEMLKNTTMVNKLLSHHASDSNHGKSAVVELFVSHFTGASSKKEKKIRGNVRNQDSQTDTIWRNQSSMISA